MATANLKIDRPVLPSIQDLLSDCEFDKLRLQSSKDAATLQRMGCDSKVFLLHEPPRPLLRSSSSRPPVGPLSPQGTSHHGTARTSPYPHVHPPVSPHPQAPSGRAFENHLPSRHLGSSLVSSHVGNAPETGRLSAAKQTLAMTDLPTYVLTPDQCPPDDDRRHGCGICHRRFNRPSSLAIHMNSHTGAQPFKCPFPGCTRRFSVNSNMRRHYRNHREGAPMTAQAQPYPTSYYSAADPPQPYYSASSSSPSPPSSPSHTDDGGLDAAENPVWTLHGRARSRSTVLPRARDGDRPPARPRACTVPGCHCNVATTGALRPAFQQQGPSTRLPPNHRP